MAPPLNTTPAQPEPLDDWTCTDCFQTISAARPPIYNATNCSCAQASRTRTYPVLDPAFKPLHFEALNLNDPVTSSLTARCSPTATSPPTSPTDAPTSPSASSTSRNSFWHDFIQGTGLDQPDTLQREHIAAAAAAAAVALLARRDSPWHAAPSSGSASSSASLSSSDDARQNRFMRTGAGVVSAPRTGPFDHVGESLDVSLSLSLQVNVSGIQASVEGGGSSGLLSSGSACAGSGSGEGDLLVGNGAWVGEGVDDVVMFGVEDEVVTW